MRKEEVAMATQDSPNLYERLGGVYSIATVVDDLIEKLFAWLPAVPRGRADVRYTIGQEEYRASGGGYHDHNWGDVPMQTLMHNWYWARASVGPYTVIASYITPPKAYRHETQILSILP